MPHTTRFEAEDWALMARVFAGEAGAAERARFDAWMREEPARHSAVERMREVWGRTGVIEEHLDVEKALTGNPDPRQLLTALRSQHHDRDLAAAAEKLLTSAV